MDLKFLFYLFLSAVLSLGGTFFIYTKGQPVTAILFLAGAAVAATYFGFRWFTTSGDLNQAIPTSWPPVINVCPDYYALWYNTDSKKTPYCVNPIGLGTFPKWTGTPTISGTGQNVLPLYTDKSDKERVTALCADCKAFGVTWEGVYDGQSCLNGTPPAPPPQGAP
jgi:hypothetical protein